MVYILTKLKKPVPDRDRIVIIEEEGVADIATVYEADDQAIYAESPTQDYAVPLADVKPFVGPSGRIFVLAADHQYIRYTNHLAKLQKSIVLEKTTHFQKVPDEAAAGVRWKEILLYALIGVLVLGVIFKK